MNKKQEKAEMIKLIGNVKPFYVETIAKALYDAGYRKVENVYIIVSHEGGIALNMYTGKGTVYNDKAKAEEALRRKNEWAKTKGYGIYELVELEAENDKYNS